MKFLFFLAGIFLSACASLGPKFEKFQAVAKDKALVYVYRPSAFSGAARSPDIVFNQKKVGTASNGSYFLFEAPPGPSKIHQRNFAGEETGEFEVYLKGGQIYFLRVDLGLPTLEQRLDSSGKSTGKTCPLQGLNMILSGSDAEILGSMDKRVQSDTCWPGFMFASEELARRELPETKLSK